MSIPTARKINENSKGEGGEGFQKDNFLKESMALKWNFQRGGGFKLKSFHGRGMDIF